MKPKLNRHKWEHFQYFSQCKICGLKKTLISEMASQPDGSNRRVFRIKYFFTNLPIFNEGCLNEKNELTLF
jgi:hypothetical protein